MIAWLRKLWTKGDPVLEYRRGLELLERRLGVPEESSRLEAERCPACGRTQEFCKTGYDHKGRLVRCDGVILAAGPYPPPELREVKVDRETLLGLQRAVSERCPVCERDLREVGPAVISGAMCQHLPPESPPIVVWSK